MRESLAPLQNKTFAFLWAAALISNIGTWMHEVGAGWLMTELSNNPLMVSLVAASTSLPVFLFVLIAGVMADIMDRRKYLLFTQAFMLFFAFGLTVFTWAGMMTPGLLLFFTFAIGTGAALMMPAWDAIIPEIVPKKDLPQAIALGSIGVNAARTIGPALAGFIIVASGTYGVFALNTLSFIGVIAALLFWNRKVPQRGMAPERFVGALKSGLRFARHTKPLQIVLIRSALFFLPAIGLLALLPLYVRDILHGDAQTLGYLQGSMGLGAIMTAFAMPQVKKHVSVDNFLFGSTIFVAIAFVILGLIPTALSACLALFLGGMAWVSAFSLLRVKAHQSVPDWVRARAMAIMMMVSFGAMTLGSAIWGQSAGLLDLQNTYLLMGGVSLLLTFAGLPFSLKTSGEADFEMADFRGQHDHFIYHPEPTDGPVQVMILYEIDSTKEQEFKTQIHALSSIRRRTGAYRWHLFKSLEAENTYIEQFLVESWEEHERQHARTGKDEKTVHDAVFSCLRPGLDKPVIRHFLHQNMSPFNRQW